jgi:ribosomal protein S18 acetylase RimI-like enzyme
MPSDVMKIRGAMPDDADPFYELFIMSSPAFEPLFAGSCEKIFKSMFRLRGNLFSHAHTLIAESGGRPAGMLLGYGYMAKVLETIPTGALFLTHLNIELALKLPMIVKSLASVGKVSMGDFHISNFAVSPEFRGKGVARGLLDGAAREAGRQRTARFSLEVEKHNLNAIRFYEKNGFSIAGEGQVDIGERKHFFHMTKPLNKKYHD